MTSFDHPPPTASNEDLRAHIARVEADLRAAIDGRDRAHGDVERLTQRVLELEGLVSHTACTIDIWRSVEADGGDADEIDQVLVDTSAMLKAALGGDPSKDARDQPEVMRHLPERTS
jgi:hypothetical protein